MQKLYQRFVDILSSHPNQKELEAALGGVADALGLPMFAYLLLPEQESAPTLISNYPGAWTAPYLAHRYDRLDPVIGTAARTVEPFEGDRISVQVTVPRAAPDSSRRRPSSESGSGSQSRFATGRDVWRL